MKKIKLSKGYETIVDNIDYEYLNQWKWYCNAQGYAVREIYFGTKNGKRIRKTIRMHRLINETSDNLEVDHIDRNTLNNQKSNLRNITHSKNMFNLTRSKNNKSGTRGVSWHIETSKWRSHIQYKYKSIHLGLFKDIKDAIKARKRAEEKYHAI